MYKYLFGMYFFGEKKKSVLFSEIGDKSRLLAVSFCSYGKIDHVGSSYALVPSLEEGEKDKFNSVVTYLIYILC